jgi:branched-chain amino acid transport system permease protein
MKLLKTEWSKGGVLLLIVAFSLFAPKLGTLLLGSTFAVDLLVQAMIFGVLASSLNLLLGYTGLPSLGHAAYLGISAYGVGILTTKFQMGAFSASVFAVLIAAATAALFGLFALRARGVYFLMITLALAMLIWGLAYRWVSMTSGDNGISGIARPTLGPVSLKDITHYYYFVLALFLSSFFLIHRIVHSPFGRSLVGIKESESRMRALGYNVWLHKYICFIIAGFFGGVSGILFVFYNGFISPSTITVPANMEVLLMVAMGGPGTILGPFIGSMVIVFLKNFVSIYTERWLIILGAIYILTILYTPKGVLAVLQKAKRSS